MSVWPEPGRGYLFFFILEQKRVRDWDTGRVHAGWGKGGTDGSGLQWLSAFAAPNFYLREGACLRLWFLSIREVC